MRDMYNDLARSDNRKEARWLACLIRAAWCHLSANVHVPGAENIRDLGSNLIMGCQCVLVSVWLMALMHRPFVGRDISATEVRKALGGDRAD